jgi:Cu-Zn family superoxide dismutase
MVPAGPHGGDMPNAVVGTDGMLKGQVLNTGVTLKPGAKSLMDADGSALVIHAKPDDYKSQPSGDAGDRIVCAVIAAPKK